MRSSTVVKLILVLAVVFFVYKKILPNVGKSTSASSTSSSRSGSATEADCAAAAASASDAWGSGLGRFVNPPYDLAAWDTFHSDISHRISSAESSCRGSSESCARGKAAMEQLSSLVSDLDSSIRSGSRPPDDVVRRQESIDHDIEDAQALQKQGR